MKIVMFNLKGGQGKSSIALNLALTMDMNIISNDIITQIEDVLPPDNFLKIGKTENEKDFGNKKDNCSPTIHSYLPSPLGYGIFFVYFRYQCRL